MKSRYGLEIRSASAADADGLSRLLSANGHPVTAADLAPRLERPGTVLLAHEWGPPSGVVAAHWFATPLEPRLVARVTLLLVDAERRRQGIARLLLKGVSQAARSAGCDRIELDRPPDQPELDAFCRATGFVPGGASFGRPLRKASGN